MQRRRGAFSRRKGWRGCPHIWLDPVLAKYQVEVIRDAFIEVDPENASYYRDNAARYISELESLDASIKSELLSFNCTLKNFISWDLNPRPLLHNLISRHHQIVSTVPTKVRSSNAQSNVECHLMCTFQGFFPTFGFNIKGS